MAMADDAGFAAALTVRQRVLSDALLFAYSQASFSRVLTLPILGSGPPASINAFLAPPVVRCNGATNALVVSLTLSGALSITPQSGAEAEGVVAQLDVSIPPEFALSAGELALTPVATDVTVTAWTFNVVLGSGYSATTDAYLRSLVFRDRLTQTIQFGLTQKLIPMPSVDISFVGSDIVAAAAPQGTTASAPGRVVDGALVVGLNVSNFQPPWGDPVTLVGDPNALQDFAGSFDIAVVTSAASLPIQLTKLEQKIVDAVGSGGVVHTLDLTAVDGQFDIASSASNSGGSATFSFSLVPQFTATRPGGAFLDTKKPITMKPRQWPALSFATANVHVDTSADLSFWDDVLVTVGTIVTFGVLLEWILETEASVANAYSMEIAGEGSGIVANLVQHVSSPALDNVKLRIAVESFQITPDGTYMGVTITPKPLPPAIIGPKSIRADLVNDLLSYTVRLPVGVVSDDPAVFVQWTVIDPGTGTVYVDDDAGAKNRLTFTFVPSHVHAGLSTYAVGCRVYRKVGSTSTDIFNDAIRLGVTPSIPTGAYIAWKYDVERPWVQFNTASDAWSYGGEPLAHRISNIHRAQGGCRMVGKRSRYIYEQHLLDTLPFPIAQIDANRVRLCDYCFYGGPGGLQATL
jgi:hypothetical protein